jgi:hypothetical protein
VQRSLETNGSTKHANPNQRDDVTGATGSVVAIITRIDRQKDEDKNQNMEDEVKYVC